MKFFDLYSIHLKNSKKVLLVTVIGFILALTIISSTNLYFDNSKQVLIDNYFSENQTYQNTPQVAISFTTPPNHYHQSLADVANIVTQTRAEYNLNFIKNINITSYLDGLTVLVNQTLRNSKILNEKIFYSTIQVLKLNSNYLKELNQINKANPLLKNSQIPSSNTSIPQVYVLFLNNFSNQTIAENVSISNNHLLNVADCQYCLPHGNTYNVNVSGMGFIDTRTFQCTTISTCEKNSNETKYPQIESLLAYNIIHAQIIMFTPNLSVFSQIIKPLPYGNNYGFYNSKFLFLISINFDYTKIDPYASISIKNQINAFDKGLSNNLLSNSDFQGVYVNFIAENKFQALIQGLTNLLFELILVSIPVLIVTLFLIGYSFDLIHSNIVLQSNLFKLRGTSGHTILFFQLCDNFIILVVSIFIALIAGVPIEFLASRSSFLLTFNNPPPAFYILNFKAISTLLIYSAVVISLGTNIKRLKKFTDFSIVDTDHRIGNKGQFNDKYHFDILILSIGVFIYFVSYFLVSNNTVEQIVGPITGIQTFLLIPSLFAFVIGFIMIVYKILPRILDICGTFLWDKTGNIIAYSFKNINRHRHTSTKGLLLLSILLAFLVFFYSLPLSVVANNEENFYYTNGAQAKGLFGKGGYNVTDLSILQNNFSRYLAGFSPYVLLTANGGGSNFEFMMVNISSYLNSSYLHFDLGLKNNIHKDFSNLKNSNTSDQSLLNILVDQKTLKESRSHIGHNLSIDNINSTINLHVIDSFNLWPVFDVNFQTSQKSFGIGDISFYTKTLNKTLGTTPFSVVIEQGIFLKFKKGVDQNRIISWIEGNTSITKISDISRDQNQFLTNAEFTLEIGQVNIDVIMLMIISFILIGMFSNQQYNERKKEIYTERALGMKLNQIITLFFFENFFLIVISMIIGLGVGMLLMGLLSVLLLNPSQQYPPFTIVYPINILLISFLIIIFLAFCMSVIPAFFVAKQRIKQYFGEAY